MNEKDYEPTQEQKEQSQLICDALETIGATDVIVVTKNSVIFGTEDMPTLHSLLSNALMQDVTFRNLVTESLAGAIDFLNQMLDACNEED
jgi:sulfur transfer complex TusBCD TusB component (DsrH family)